MVDRMSANEMTVDDMLNWFKLDSSVPNFEIRAGNHVNQAPVREKPRPKRAYQLSEDKQMAYVEEYVKNERENLMIGRVESQSESQASLSEPLSQMSLIEEDSNAAEIANLNSLNDDHDKIFGSYEKSFDAYDPKLLSTRYKDEIISSVRNQQVVIIEGSTGSGKTTQVPQFILDDCVQHRMNCNIVVTQPRRIAAMSIARRVCEVRKMSLGQIIGYQVGMDNKTSPNTRLTYVTTGILLQKLVAKKHMNDYTHIILDEVHERDQDMDFCLLVIRKFLRTVSRSVKVILMSATFDLSAFGNYFATPFHGRLESPRVISLRGRPYGISEYWLSELKALGPLVPQDIAYPGIHIETYNIACKLIQKFDDIEKDENAAKRRGAVLVFLPGLEEINRMEKTMNENNLHIQFKWSILRLHSTNTVEEQSRAFMDVEEGHRKVILSTNIAESSITVRDIKFVIDFCLTKNLVCDTQTNYTSLQLEWASKANCKQRRGRTGRTGTGRVYRLVRQELYKQFLEYTTPEMKRCPLEQIVLNVKVLDLDEPKALLALALDPPKLGDIEQTIFRLKEIGALDIKSNGKYYEHDGDLTFLGRILAKLPVDIHVGKLFVLGFVFGCLEECLIIGSGLSIQNLFLRPRDKQLEAWEEKVSWARKSYSDCFAILNAYMEWQNKKHEGSFRMRGAHAEKTWATKMFLNLNKLFEVSNLVNELTKRLSAMNISVPKCPLRKLKDSEKDLILKVILAGAFYPYYFLQSHPDERDIVRNLDGFDPQTTVSLNGFPVAQGILYKSQVDELFKSFKCKYQIYFSDSKAYIEFARRKEDRQLILQSVYSALKMRLLRLPLNIRLYSDEVARKQMDKIECMQSLRETGKMRTSKFSIAAMSNFKRVSLPNLEQITIEIVITEVTDLGHLWARYKNNEYELIRINNLISQCKHNLQALRPPITPGAICLAKLTKTEIFRARIEEINGNNITVFLVDDGKEVTLLPKDLYEINEVMDDLFHIPGQIFDCVLSEIKPSAKYNVNGIWSREAIGRIRHLVEGREKLYGLIYSVVQGIVHLELRLADGKSINELLVKEGYAEIAEESYQSKQNNELRQRFRIYSNNIDNFSPTRHDENGESDVLFLPELIQNAQTGSQLKALRGPFSPVEVSFTGITKGGVHRPVKIEMDSVNSVVLDVEPQEQTLRFMVASHVSLTPSCDKICARNTTLYPNIRNLLALISMVFAPQVELRVDQKYMQYIGVLCGLGFNPENEEALFEEHDLEIPFDAELDEQDFSLVNFLRWRITKMLKMTSEEDAYPINAIVEIQNECRECILQLLQKIRSSKEITYYHHPYAWNRIRSDRILKHTIPGCPPRVEQTLIKAVQLNKRAAVMNNLEDLYDRATLTDQFSKMYCLLCGDIPLQTCSELRAHLRSDGHLSKEAQFDHFELFPN